jgi:hypothetical protein
MIEKLRMYFVIPGSLFYHKMILKNRIEDICFLNSFFMFWRVHHTGVRLAYMLLAMCAKKPNARTQA